MNPLAGAMGKLVPMVQYLALEAPGGADFLPAMTRYMTLSKSTVQEFRDAMVQALEKNVDLGITNKDLIELVKRMNSPKDIARLVYKKLSPNDQEAHPELAESEVVEASFTPNAAIGSVDSTGAFVVTQLLSVPVSMLSELARFETRTEAVGPAPGASFTSTANTAPYAVPLGSMLRRKWWKRKKKKR